jgi:erythromycin esterase-like protein
MVSEGIKMNQQAILDQIVELAKNKRLVLLGESSHGVSEFNSFRAKIIQELYR